MADDKKLFAEQLEYYRARAQEYDKSIQQSGLPAVDLEWQHIVDALRALPPKANILELACGTGLWTQELIEIGDTVTAIDGAPEMLDVNRAKLQSDRVVYRQADLFEWRAEESYDLVFFGFWISHVPPDRLNAFLGEVTKAVKPGGRLFIADEPGGGKQLSGPAENNLEQTRTTLNGNSFRIIKVYHDPKTLKKILTKLGFKDIQIWTGDFFFYLTGVRG
jgi:2-polyprenyl-3-methyl-5-hydroxy-6-metoxy-1,4-benzoquinol methylase